MSGGTEREILASLRRLVVATSIDPRMRRAKAIGLFGSWPRARRCILNPSFMEARRLAGLMPLSIPSETLATKCCQCPKHRRKLNRRPMATIKTITMQEQHWGDVS
jgi:hypothetical protein